MIQLNTQDLYRVRPLFEAPHAALVMDAVLAGSTPMDAWVDDPSKPRSAFLWDRAHSYYLAGEPAEEVLAELGSLLRNTIVPEARVRERLFFKVYHGSEAWEQHLASLFAPVPLRSLERSFYAYEAPEPPVENWPVPARFSVRPIDARIVGGQLDNADDLRSEIRSMWTSLDEFRAKGFGFCALRGDEIAGWCTAEYLSPGKCGLGVETVEQYQQRGLATAMAAAAVKESLSRGLKPHWDSWTSNTPSVRIAEKVGFRKVETYIIHLGTWPDA